MYSQMNNYIAINAKDCNIYAPVSDIYYLLLKANTDNTANLNIECHETIYDGNTSKPLNLTVTDEYNSLLSLYLQIVSQLSQSGFISLSCGTSRLLINHAQVNSVARGFSNDNPKQQEIVLFYNSNISGMSGYIYNVVLLSSATKDLTAEYTELLNQLKGVSSKNNFAPACTFWNNPQPVVIKQIVPEDNGCVIS